ncbi:MAG: entericidin A/B family lipoprotein [Candidatus Hydrogenedentes bacterium]|nr:entericidin A/B family lipoprotein [Candidatus Hydrogenedentota bacterium]
MENRIIGLLKRAGVISLAVVLLALSGCNTIRGFGEDVEEGGEEIQEHAADAQS